MKNGEDSTEWKPVEAGVIQGSILGPILFLIFISDINDHVPNSIELIKYADDILIYLSLANWDGEIVQAATDGIARWCAKNKMKLNKNKCLEMTMKNGTNEPPPIITLEDHAIESTQSYKYLGIQINTELDWELHSRSQKHWTHVHKKISSTPYLLRQLRHLGFKTEVLVDVYRSLSLSHFTYSAPILLSTTTATLNEMVAFQRRALKAIGTNDPSQRHKYGITTIEQLLRCQSRRIVGRILRDPSHAITAKIPRTLERSGRPSTFKTSKARTTKYANSILQAHIREARDGTSNLYTRETTDNSHFTNKHQQNKKAKAQCPVCAKLFINLAMHLARSKTCKPKQ